MPPDWLPRWSLQLEEEDEEEEAVFTIVDNAVVDAAVVEETSDFALMHVVAVKAIANGVVTSGLDSKNRKSIVLEADDGTKYWYADIGATLIEDGARVKAGQVIARTKIGAQAIPEITPAKKDEKLLLPAAEQSPLKLKTPTQIVFVEPPPVAPIDFVEPPPKKYARLVKLPEPKKYVRLVPDPFSLRAPPSTSTPSKVWRVLVPIGGLAALLLALSMVLPTKQPTRRRKRRR